MRISEGRIMQAKDEVISRDWKRVEEAGSSWKQEWAWHIRGRIWKAVWPEQSEKGHIGGEETTEAQGSEFVGLHGLL